MTDSGSELSVFEPEESYDEEADFNRQLLEDELDLQAAENRAALVQNAGERIRHKRYRYTSYPRLRRALRKYMVGRAAVRKAYGGANVADVVQYRQLTPLPEYVHRPSLSEMSYGAFRRPGTLTTLPYRRKRFIPWK